MRSSTSCPASASIHVPFLLSLSAPALGLYLGHYSRPTLLTFPVVVVTNLSD